MLPPAVRRGVSAALGRLAGGGASIRGVEPVSGGCVSPVARVETDGGDRFFLKWSTPHQPPGLLAAESRGLSLLAETRTVRVPRVLARDDGSGDGPEWLLLEWLPPATAAPEAWERLGAALAALHRHQGRDWGDDEENFIGPLPQSNAAAPDWPTFWWCRRLEPQLRLARGSGALDAAAGRRFAALEGRLPDLLGAAGQEGPSRLHGDLWSGNVHPTGGVAALVDPSVYHGHREVDLAMAELFGGFHPAFRRAYETAWPLEPGFAAGRRATYQLYYLLVHVNLFGAGYTSRTLAALAETGV